MYILQNILYLLNYLIFIPYTHGYLLCIISLHSNLCKIAKNKFVFFANYYIIIKKFIENVRRHYEYLERH